MYLGIYTYILSNFVFFDPAPIWRLFLISWENNRDCHITMSLSLKTMEVQIKGDPWNKRFRDCAIITWRGVGKLVGYAPSQNNDIKATPPHTHTHTPWKKSPPIDSLIPSLLVGFLPPVKTSLQMTLRRMSKSNLKSHQNHWTLSLCRLRMNWVIPHLLQHLWHWGSRVRGWELDQSTQLCFHLS